MKLKNLMMNTSTRLNKIFSGQETGSKSSKNIVNFLSQKANAN